MGLRVKTNANEILKYIVKNTNYDLDELLFLSEYKSKYLS